MGYAQSYDTYGGSSLYAPVADLLTVRLTGDYGPAVTAVYFTGFLPSRTRKPRRTLGEDFKRFEASLKRLPRLTFRQKLKRIEISFRSEHFFAEDDRESKMSAARRSTAAAEVAEAFALIPKRVKPSADFDSARFLADVSRLLTTRIDKPAEWEAIRLEALALDQAILAAKDPWALLEIDWGHYHPKARRVLDDPFFWQDADDMAPHGNDTGADLLEDFRRWDSRRPGRAPLVFLERLLKDWDIEPIDWQLTDETQVRRLEQERSIDLHLCNEAAIALAFAVIKRRGSCPANLIEMALAALSRTALAVHDSRLAPDVKAAWDGAIAKMRGKLLVLQR